MADQSATFTAVDLSRLPAPAVIEELSFDAIFAEMLVHLQQLVPDFDAAVESDPAVKVLEVAAYREMLVRQRVNDAARAVMVAYAAGADLDHLAALMSVPRLVIDPGNPALLIPPTLESDADLRRRLVLAPEGLSVAGPEGAYIFHALSADPAVLDASATSPAPGQVLVTILSRDGSGAASPALLDTVAAYVSDETRRPLTDYVTVQSATIVEYSVFATITTFSGPDGGVVLAEANRRLADYVQSSHRLGRDITISGLHAALHVEGVHNVALSQPAADLVLDRTQAAYCTEFAISHAGTGE